VGGRLSRGGTEPPGLGGGCGCPPFPLGRARGNSPPYLPSVRAIDAATILSVPRGHWCCSSPDSRRCVSRASRLAETCDDPVSEPDQAIWLAPRAGRADPHRKGGSSRGAAGAQRIRAARLG